MPLPVHAQVCNHPDLFEGRPIVSSYDLLPGITVQVRRRSTAKVMRYIVAQLPQFRCTIAEGL